MSGAMYPCPGGCGRSQVRAWPCRTCRLRLPEPIQQRLRFIEDDAESSTSALYQETFAAAAAWFRCNPNVRVVVNAGDEKRILTHYAAGTEISGIAAICGLDRDAVLDVVNRRAGFSRDKARELLDVRVRRLRSVARRHREEPVPPVDEQDQFAPQACLEAASPSPDPAPEPEPESAPVSAGDAPDVPTEAEDIDEHLVDVEPEQASPPAITPTVSPLLAYDAWLCLQCGSRWSEPRRCCRRSTIPVTVTVTRRAA